MLRREYLLSKRLPDYFKSEARIGKEGGLPLVSVLDDLCESLAAAACLKAFDLSSNTASLERQRRALELRGLKTATLSSQEVSDLDALSSHILATKGTLRSIRLLARVYLPGARIRTGRPYRKTVVGKRRQIALVDRLDRQARVFVRLSRRFDFGRIEEFSDNALRLLPRPFQLVVGEPKFARKPICRIATDRPTSWEGRKLPCHTSPK